MLPSETHSGSAISLSGAGAERLSPPVAVADSHGTVRVFIEVAHAPFAWQLNIGGPGRHP